ncbi:MAG: hypothetical protein ACRCTU_08270 [Zoogloea sp.]|uniref:hypothetical protein n=1 Tax=Zoogloea sp. TaxID=49181 RepID=UPI003F34A696
MRVFTAQTSSICTDLPFKGFMSNGAIPSGLGSQGQRRFGMNWRWIVRGFALLLMIAGMGVAIATYRENSAYDRIKGTGEVAVVKPIAQYSKRYGSYSAEFRFTTAHSQEVVQRQSFSQAILDDLLAGHPVVVWYDPYQPNNFVFEKEVPGWGDGLSGAGGAVLGLLLILLI